jgi:dynein heavy chain
MEDACYFLRKHILEPVTTVDNNICQSTMRIMDSFFSDYVETEIKLVTSDNIDELEAMLSELFIYAFIWSLGVTGDSASRKKMNVYIREKITELEIDFPEEASVFDWCFDIKSATWMKWTET